MIFTKFNLKDAKEVWQEEAREDGMAQGKAETAGIGEFLPTLKKDLTG